MRRLWGVLEKKKSTREVVARLLPISVAVVAGVWAVFTYSIPADRPTRVSQFPALSAALGGVALERVIGGSAIAISPSPETLRR
jgi:hypothetical protein